MYIVSKAVKGKEFTYSLYHSFQVSKAAKEIICKALNDSRYMLKDNETWHIYEIDKYDNVYDIVKNQYMRLYKNKVKIYSTYC